MLLSGPWQPLEVASDQRFEFDGIDQFHQLAFEVKVAQRYVAFARQTRNHAVCETIRQSEHYAATLKGSAWRPDNASDPAFDEAASLKWKAATVRLIARCASVGHRDGRGIEAVSFLLGLMVQPPACRVNLADPIIHGRRARSAGIHNLSVSERCQSILSFQLGYGMAPQAPGYGMPGERPGEPVDCLFVIASLAPAVYVVCQAWQFSWR